MYSDRFVTVESKLLCQYQNDGLMRQIDGQINGINIFKTIMKIFIKKLHFTI